MHYIFKKILVVLNTRLMTILVDRCNKRMQFFSECSKATFLRVINQTAVGSQFIDEKFTNLYLESVEYGSDEYYYYN